MSDVLDAAPYRGQPGWVELQDLLEALGISGLTVRTDVVCTARRHLESQPAHASTPAGFRMLQLRQSERLRYVDTSSR